MIIWREMVEEWEPVVYRDSGDDPELCSADVDPALWIAYQDANLAAAQAHARLTEAFNARVRA